MLTLADHRKTRYGITLDPGATAPERNAARDLARHLQRITGAAFPILAPTAAGDRPRIAVGPSAARALGISLRILRSLGDEGLIVRTVGGNLVLTGAPGAPRTGSTPRSG